MSHPLFSDRAQLERIADILSKYVRLPFSTETIPGAVLEGVLGYVRDADVLNTYDFVDVVRRQDRCGWQVKSTKAATPVTWKRAKIPERDRLILESEAGTVGLQTLGDAILDFCNHHVRESLELYDLDCIGYARLIVEPSGVACYFERLLVTRERPVLFEPSEFLWKWSDQKQTKKKEQLSALHGIHLPTGKKWFAWHGRGENQLHFSGEPAWWPQRDSQHYVSFRMPKVHDKLSYEALASMLDSLHDAES